MPLFLCFLSINSTPFLSLFYFLFSPIEKKIIMGASLFRREREIKKETLDFFKRRRYEGGGGRERGGGERLCYLETGFRLFMKQEKGWQRATCRDKGA